MTDPRDFDRRMDLGPDGLDTERPLEMEHRMGSPTPWGWIAGAVFVIVMLALVFTSSEATRTANNEAARLRPQRPRHRPLRFRRPRRRAKADSAANNRDP